VVAAIDAGLTFMLPDLRTLFTTIADLAAMNARSSRRAI
jgi:hypothetical protein